MKSEALLSFNELSCGHGGRRGPSVITGAQASVFSGRLIGLIGPNGSGKTTLLSTLSGCLVPQAGSILLDGIPLDKHSPADIARKMALVLTEAEKPEHASVEDVVALGRHPHTGFLGFMDGADREAIRSAIEDADATRLAGKLFSELSDGERQRALIARALAQEAPILLLDEPEVFLDLPSKRRLLSLLGGLARGKNRLVIVSLHDIELAVDSCDELWLLHPDDSGASRLLRGTAEALALSGKIGSAFGAVDDGGSPEISAECDNPLVTALDLLFPQDRCAVQGRGSFILSGGGPQERFWTGRLLKRLGFASGPARGSIVIAPRSLEGGGGDSAFEWILNDGSEKRFPGLEELALQLAPGQYPTEQV